jgi:hypothetical protein
MNQTFLRGWADHDRMDDHVLGRPDRKGDLRIEFSPN